MRQICPNSLILFALLFAPLPFSNCRNFLPPRLVSWLTEGADTKTKSDAYKESAPEEIPRYQPDFQSLKYRENEEKNTFELDPELSKYIEEGKESLKKLEIKSLESDCYAFALASIGETCQSMSQEGKIRFALGLTACHLEETNHKYDGCPEYLDTNICFETLDDFTITIYTHFTLHVDHICYFIQSKNWQNQVQRTIQMLSIVSDETVEKLGKSLDLQKDVVDSQIKTLKNVDVSISKQKEMETVLSQTHTKLQTHSDFLEPLLNSLTKQAESQQRKINEISDNQLQVIAQSEKLQYLIENAQINLEAYLEMVSEAQRITTAQYNELLPFVQNVNVWSNYATLILQSGKLSILFLFFFLLLQVFTSFEKTKAAKRMVNLLLLSQYLLEFFASEHTLLNSYGVKSESITQTMLLIRLCCFFAIVLSLLRAFLNPANSTLRRPRCICSASNKIQNQIFYLEQHPSQNTLSISNGENDSSRHTDIQERLLLMNEEGSKRVPFKFHFMESKDELDEGNTETQSLPTLSRLAQLSYRELQNLAVQFNICQGNAKKSVMVEGIKNKILAGNE